MTVLPLARILFLALLAIVCGCGIHRAEPPDSARSLPSERVFLHTTEYPEENFPLLAEWYTGKAKNWGKLRGYNGHIRSFFIPKGATVRMPESLVIWTQPLTKEFYLKRRRAFLPRAYVAGKSGSTKSGSTKSTEKNKGNKSKPADEASELGGPFEGLNDLPPTDRAEDSSDQDPLIENLIENFSEPTAPEGNPVEPGE